MGGKLDEFSTEIGSLRTSVSNLERAQTSAHEIMFAKLDSLTHQLTVASVKMPLMAESIAKIEKKTDELEREKNERKGAIYILTLVAGVVGSIITMLGEWFSRGN